MPYMTKANKDLLASLSGKSDRRLGMLFRDAFDKVDETVDDLRQLVLNYTQTDFAENLLKELEAGIDRLRNSASF